MQVSGIHCLDSIGRGYMSYKLHRCGYVSYNPWVQFYRATDRPYNCVQMCWATRFGCIFVSFLSGQIFPVWEPLYALILF
jgi:hypothetical protein